jgi:hypothetical protein
MRVGRGFTAKCLVAAIKVRTIIFANVRTSVVWEGQCQEVVREFRIIHMGYTGMHKSGRQVTRATSFCTVHVTLHAPIFFEVTFKSFRNLCTPVRTCVSAHATARCISTFPCF